MKKITKGNYGYIKYEKKKRGIITFVMFAIPMIIFITGLLQTGTRKNLFTLVAVLGMLPAAKVAVNLIMILMQKSAMQETFDQTEARAKNLVRAYELTVTAYEGSMSMEAMVICGNQVAAYSSAEKGKFDFMEKHMAKILSSNGYYSVKVKIFRELKPFLERIDQLAKNPEKYQEGIKFTPDENYPDLSREELIKHVLMAISI
ncbi:MAG: hypothetical protein PHE06_02400 [Lachnospiraceae bacterium]|nr:hypothetical protein [Lachnospiraceae bacterium]MDD3794822.1 hypothetical protein [Lachnospiraceae bacterium]